MQYAKVAAGQTTAQISVPGSAEFSPRGRDYIERLVITAASTAAPGSVTLFDGTTSILVHTFVPAGMTSLVEIVPVGVTSKSTKGFNITTGTSVSVVAVGHFS